MAIVLFPSPRIYDYDQQSAPGSPTTNQTWLERDSNNIPVNGWFWNGIYWLDIQEYRNSFSWTFASAETRGGGDFINPPQYNPAIYQGFLIQRSEGEVTRATGTHDGSNYYVLTNIFRGFRNSVRTGSFSDSTNLITTATKTLFSKSHSNTFSDLMNGYYQVSTTLVGSPGLLDVYWSIITRGVRR